ncbi:hypothetical protein HDU96_002243, partial [Phlyctochytrium bullatum]
TPDIPSSPPSTPVTSTNTATEPTASNPIVTDRRGNNRRRHPARQHQPGPVAKLSDKEWFKRLAHENLKILREARRAPFETDEDLYTAVFRARKQAFRDINDRAIERRRVRDRETRLSFQEQDFYPAPPTPSPSIVSLPSGNVGDAQLPDAAPVAHSVASSNPSHDPSDPNFVPADPSLSVALEAAIIHPIQHRHPRFKSARCRIPTLPITSTPFSCGCIHPRAPPRPSPPPITTSDPPPGPAKIHPADEANLYHSSSPPTVPHRRRRIPNPPEPTNPAPKGSNPRSPALSTPQTPLQRSSSWFQPSHPLQTTITAPTVRSRACRFHQTTPNSRPSHRLSLPPLHHHESTTYRSPAPLAPRPLAAGA